LKLFFLLVEDLKIAIGEMRVVPSHGKPCFALSLSFIGFEIFLGI
jgi:hypothetical protein